MKSGPSASFGITWLAKMYGHNKSRKNLFSASTNPAMNPIEHPIINPSAISSDVTQICSHKYPLYKPSQSTIPISLGAGITNFETPDMLQKSSQPIINERNKSEEKILVICFWPRQFDRDILLNNHVCRSKDC